MIKIIKSYIGKIYRKSYKKTYSQSGEDILIEDVFRVLGINQPKYIDVGANNPISKNNTYLFYSKGSSGICIEPNPEIYKEIKNKRPRDIALNVGIGPSNIKEADYYILTSKALSTFIKEEAEKAIKEANYGPQKIEKVIKMPLVDINDIVKKIPDRSFDLLSLDTEGYDFEIIKSLNLETNRPKVVCVETARYVDNKIIKNKDLIDYMEASDYLLYADTYVNSIFVDKKIWPQ